MENKGKLLRTVIMGVAIVGIIAGIFSLFTNATDLVTYTSIADTTELLESYQKSLLTIQNLAAGALIVCGIFSILGLIVFVLSMIFKHKAIGIVSLAVDCFIVLLTIILIGVVNGAVNGFITYDMDKVVLPIYTGYIGGSFAYLLGAGAVQLLIPQMAYFIIVAVLQIVSLIVDKKDDAKAVGAEQAVESKTVQAAAPAEKICPKCGAKLAEDAGFCGECGAKIDVEPENHQENVCPKCGAKLAEDAGFCGECGAKIER